MLFVRNDGLHLNLKFGLSPSPRGAKRQGDKAGGSANRKTTRTVVPAENPEGKEYLPNSGDAISKSSASPFPGASAIRTSSTVLGCCVGFLVLANCAALVFLLAAYHSPQAVSGYAGSVGCSQREQYPQTSTIRINERLKNKRSGLPREKAGSLCIETCVICNFLQGQRNVGPLRECTAVIIKGRIKTLRCHMSEILFHLLYLASPILRKRPCKYRLFF